MTINKVLKICKFKGKKTDSIVIFYIYGKEIVNMVYDRDVEGEFTFTFGRYIKSFENIYFSKYDDVEKCNRWYECAIDYYV